VTVLVRPFEVETGVQADGTQVARALRERITLDAFGGGQPVLALDDSEAARAAHHDAVIRDLLVSRPMRPLVIRADTTRPVTITASWCAARCGLGVVQREHGLPAANASSVIRSRSARATCVPSAWTPVSTSNGTDEDGHRRRGAHACS